MIKKFPAIAVALLMVSVVATAQIRPMSGKALVPNSSIKKPTDIGRLAHTDIRVFLPNELRNEQTSGPPYAGYAYEAGYRDCGCNPNSVAKLPVGGARMIALVDA